MPSTDTRLAVVVPGVCLPILAAAAAWWAGQGFISAICAGGAVAGPIAAWRRAGSLTREGWWRGAVRSAIEAVLLAAAALSLALMVSTLIGPAGVPGTGPAAAAWVPPVVVPFALLWGLPVAVPVALAAGYLARRAAGIGPDRARRHLAALAIVTALVGVVTLLATLGGVSPGAPA